MQKGVRVRFLVSIGLRATCLGILGAAVAVTSGCNKVDGKGTDAAAAQSAAHPLLISPEDLVTVRSNALSSGPAITGSIQPERRADLRAEVSAIVLTVLKENGDRVKRGDLLVRLDDTSIRDSLMSADASEKAAVQAYEQAERQYQRMLTLQKTGVVSTQQVEDAESRRNSTQSDKEAARSRVVTARQQLERTEVRAPFEGIISDRKVSAGDTAQVGKELVKVIDPGSLRFEGLVSADSIGDVRAGQPVMFRVHGYTEREFKGTITRVNPAANTTTRQVEVLVAFDDAKDQPNVAGLYAGGRVETRRTAALTIPPTALVRDGDAAFAWRLKDRTLEKVSVSVGDRDPRSGEFVLKGGITEGDKLVRYPSTTLQNGQSVELSPGPALTTAAAQ